MYFNMCSSLLNNSLFSMYDDLFNVSNRLLFNDFCSPTYYVYSYSVKNKPQKETFSPSINVSEDNHCYYLNVDLPGMTKDQVKMEFNENESLLTISGERMPNKDHLQNNNEDESSCSTSNQNDTTETENETNSTNNTEQCDRKYSLKESYYGKFERTVKIPKDADFNSIQATMENGLLKITISKTEKQIRSIQIQ